MEQAEQLLVTHELVRRLEDAERAVVESKLMALHDEDAEAHGVEMARLGQTTLLAIRSRHYNPSYNRAMGFSTADAEHLDEALCWLREREVTFWFDVVPAWVDGDTLRRLAAAGLHPVFTLNQVFAVPQRIPSVSFPEGRMVEISLPQQGHDMAAVVSAAFGIPQEIQESTERALCTEYSGPEWHIYMSYLDDKPASMAALHVHGGVASIDAMGTVPDFRRRGCQTALLAHCMGEAARMGCNLIASQTRPSSTSEKNMTRAGLRIAYTKMLYSDRDVMEHKS